MGPLELSRRRDNLGALLARRHRRSCRRHNGARRCADSRAKRDAWPRACSAKCGDWDSASIEVLRSYAASCDRLAVLSAPGGEAYRATGLTFHDLRDEAGSRLLEFGWSLHQVKDLLGHANISQTDTYLNATKVGLQEAMQRLDASRCTTVAQKGAKRVDASVQQASKKRRVKRDLTVS